MCLNPIMPSHFACPRVFTFDWFLGLCWCLRCIIFNSVLHIKPAILNAPTRVGGAPATAFHGLIVSEETGCALGNRASISLKQSLLFQYIVQLRRFLSPGHTSRALLLWCRQPTNLIFQVDWLWIRVGNEIVPSEWVRLSGHMCSCLLYACMVFTFKSFTYIPALGVQNPSGPANLNNSYRTW